MGRNSRENTKVRAGGGGDSQVGRQWIFHKGQGALCWFRLKECWYRVCWFIKYAGLD